MSIAGSTRGALKKLSQSENQNDEQNESLNVKETAEETQIIFFISCVSVIFHLLFQNQCMDLYQIFTVDR